MDDEPPQDFDEDEQLMRNAMKENQIEHLNQNDSDIDSDYDDQMERDHNVNEEQDQNQNNQESNSDLSSPDEE
jgi:hypothetical protein